MAWILEVSQENLKNCSLHEGSPDKSIYRNDGGQRGIKEHVLNLPRYTLQFLKRPTWVTCQSWFMGSKVQQGECL